MSKEAKSVFARSLSVCRQMKNNFFLALFFLIFLSISCASADKLQNQDQEQSEVQTGSEPAPVELKEKKSLADEIIVRDIYSKEEPLFQRELSMKPAGLPQAKMFSLPDHMRLPLTRKSLKSRMRVPLIIRWEIWYIT